MKQDFKIGMLVGLAVLVVLLVGWVLLRGRPAPQAGYGRTQNPVSRTLEPERTTPAVAVGNPQPYGAAVPSPAPGIAPARPATGAAEPNAVASASAQATPAPAVAAVQPQQPTPAPVAAAAKPARTHKVAEGETLSDIADHYYGTSDQWTKIYRANRSALKDPDKIYPGMELVIPD